MFLIVIASIVTLLGLIWYRIQNNQLIKFGNSIPGPVGIPILGNAHYFINKPVEDNLRILEEFLKQYGKTFRVWIGNELNVFFAKRKDLEVIMSGMLFVNKAGPYELMKPWLNEGLLISKDKKWHKRRKIITPAFHFKILEEYLIVFEKHAKVFCKVLSEKSGKDPFQLYEHINRYTLDVISGILKRLA